MQIAQLGYGRWGRNLFRVFSSLPGVAVSVVADIDPCARSAIPPPALRRADPFSAIAQPEIEAVVIATPPDRHHQLARAALAANKHVFVEKPLALEIAHARELVRLAAERQRILMVGHVVLFDGAVRWIKTTLDAGLLGALERVRFVRSGTPRPGRRLGALWSLAPHDLALVDHWLGAPSPDLEATTWSSRDDGLDEEARLVFRVPRGPAVDIRVGWLRSHARRVVLVGSEATVRYETWPARRLTLCRRGQPPAQVDLPQREPLRAEAAHFVASVRRGLTPLSDGASALRVVEALAAAERSAAAYLRAPTASEAGLLRLEAR